MSVVQDLSRVWCEAVKDGKIVNEFNTDGGKCAFGLKLQNGKPDYFARDIKIGDEIAASVRERNIDSSDFIIQFNGYRALKPGGGAPNTKDVSAEVNKCRFCCQEPKGQLSILRRDPLAQLALPNWKWNAYYNAVPFEKEGHFLWLPVLVDGVTTIIPHFIQELSVTFLEDAMALFRNSNKMIIFFNSLHAGASVNHIHLQAVFHKQILAIEKAPVVERAGLRVLDGYPAHGIVFDRQNVEPAEIWLHLTRLQENNTPFNLIFIGERICLIPRNSTHEVVEEFPTGILASMELAGKIITVDEKLYDSINFDTVQAAFRKTTVGF